MPRTRLAGTLALPGTGFLVPGWAGWRYGCLVRGSRGRSPSPVTGFLVPGWAGWRLRMPRARLAGTLALPGSGLPRAGVGRLAFTDASYAARGDARPPRERIASCRGGQVGGHGCLVRGSRGRSPSPGADSSCRGGQVGVHGCLVRGSRGRSPSPGPDCLVPGWAGWRSRMPRTRLAGTLALPGTGSSCRGGSGWRSRMPRARLAGTLALPGTDCLVPGWAGWRSRMPRARLAGTLALPGDRIPRAGVGQVGVHGCLVRGSRGRSPSPVTGCLVPRVCQTMTFYGCLVRGSRGRSPSPGPVASCQGGRLAFTDASCAARGDARPPRDRLPRAGVGQVGVHGCLVRGSRGRSPSPGTVASCRGVQVGVHGCLVRGSRGRSPSPGPVASCRGRSGWRSRMPRARLAGTLVVSLSNGARPPRDRLPRAGVVGRRSRMPRTRLAGTLALPGTGCLVPGCSDRRSRMPRARLAGTCREPVERRSPSP